MKVLLLQPNYDAHVIHPPLGFGYLASFLRENTHSVFIFDGTLKNASLDDFEKVVSDYQPDMVGVSVLSRGHQRAKEMIKRFKKKFRELPVVIGGTQVTADPQEILLDLGADFAVVGEGEKTLVELVAAGREQKNLKKIDGLVYKDKSGRVIVNRPRGLIENLDSLPFPAWDLIPPRAYRIVPILEPAKAFPVAPIITSRGCPYNCSFCASNVTWGRRIRFRSPQNVLREIELLKNEFGVREIHFADDNFTMDIARAEKICDLLISKKIGLPWQCPNGVRIDRLTLPLLKKMKASGCYAVGLGIESGNQQILDKNHKNLDLKIVPAVLNNLKKVGIESYGFFILGLPGDSPKTMKETIDFALRSSFDRVWFNIFTPYPGSTSFKDWLGKRKLSEIDWDKHDCSTAVFKIKGMTLNEIEVLQTQALKKFYLRPKILWSLVSSLRFREIITFLMSRFFGKTVKPLSQVVHRIIRKRKNYVRNLWNFQS